MKLVIALTILSCFVALQSNVAALDTGLNRGPPGLNRGPPGLNENDESQHFIEK